MLERIFTRSRPIAQSTGTSAIARRRRMLGWSAGVGLLLALTGATGALAGGPPVAYEKTAVVNELEITTENGGLSVAATEVDPFNQETQVYPTLHGRPVAEREFEIPDGEWRGERFDFPRDGFVCFLGRLAARTE